MWKRGWHVVSMGMVCCQHGDGMSLAWTRMEEGGLLGKYNRLVRFYPLEQAEEIEDGQTEIVHCNILELDPTLIMELNVRNRDKMGNQE